jgi:cytochrome c-type biogenesis protein
VQKKKDVNSFFSAFFFGMVYSVSLTPCVGAFLGSAIMLASNSGTALRGTMLLFVYSLGMGIPFLISAVLIEKLTDTFDKIKKHYKVINTVCGIFLIIVGVLMAFGLINKLISVFS